MRCVIRTDRTGLSGILVTATIVIIVPIIQHYVGNGRQISGTSAQISNRDYILQIPFGAMLFRTTGASYAAVTIDGHRFLKIPIDTGASGTRLLLGQWRRGSR